MCMYISGALLAIYCRGNLSVRIGLPLGSGSNLEHEVGDRVRRYAEHGHQYVGQRQVHDEVVGDCAHAFKRVHHVHDQEVTGYGQQYYQGVHQHEYRHHPVGHQSGPAPFADAGAAWRVGDAGYVIARRVGVEHDVTGLSGPVF